MNALALLIGRVLLAAIFVESGVRQLTGGIQPIADNLANHGFPYSTTLAFASATCQVVGGVMLIAGIFTRIAAIAFFIYIGALAVVFHNFWAMEGAARATNTVIFYFHLASMGGMLYVAVFGAGRFAVHHK